jgi:hypothetical protein
MGGFWLDRYNLLARAGPINIQRHTVGSSIQNRLSLPAAAETRRGFAPLLAAAQTRA